MGLYGMRFFFIILTAFAVFYWTSYHDMDELE